MDKELAQKILGLSLDEERIQQQKYDLRKSLEMYSWEEVLTRAMAFLMEESHGN